MLQSISDFLSLELSFFNGLSGSRLGARHAAPAYLTPQVVVESDQIEDEQMEQDAKDEGVANLVSRLWVRHEICKAKTVVHD